jgi:hypothetical protein
MCYIGRKSCGCVVAAVVDNPDRKKDVARSVAGFIKEGLTIEHVTCDYFRKNFKECECGE